MLEMSKQSVYRKVLLVTSLSVFGRYTSLNSINMSVWKTSWSKGHRDLQGITSREIKRTIQFKELLLNL